MKSVYEWGLRKKKYVLVLVVISIFSGFYLYVRSQTGEVTPEGIQVSPYRFDWDLNDTEERSGTINLKNYSDVPYKVTIERENFFVSDDTTEAKFFIPDDNHPLKAYDVINWIEIEEHVTLGPGEAKDIPFKVTVPPETPTGGYYGALFFDSKPDIPEDDQQEGTAKVLINQKVGSLLVMAVKGDQPISRGGKLEAFHPLRKVFFNKPAELFADVYNSGNLHYKVNGTFNIYKFGQKIVNSELPSLVIYPGKHRNYPLKWEFSSWSYGYYKAVINFTSEDGDIQMQGETTFWVIPWKTTVSIIILLIIIYLILKFFNTKFEIKMKTKEVEQDNPDHPQPPRTMPMGMRMPNAPQHVPQPNNRPQGTRGYSVRPQPAPQRNIRQTRGRLTDIGPGPRRPQV